VQRKYARQVRLPSPPPLFGLLLEAFTMFETSAKPESRKTAAENGKQHGSGVHHSYSSGLSGLHDSNAHHLQAAE
jgi:hypothetical protein